jgi:hypothetical protein
MIKTRSFIVRTCSIFGRNEEAKKKSPFLVPYLCAPLGCTFHPTNANVSAGVFSVQLSIGVVLSMSTLTDVLAAVIQGIVISMIHLLPSLTPKNEPMHGRIFSSYPSVGVKSARTRIPPGLPVKFRKPFIVGSVHNGILALRKWNQAVGWVLRLGYFVSYHTTFFHVPTSNGSMIPAAIIT